MENARVVIVEDSPSLSESIAGFLMLKGHTVVEQIFSYPEALDYFAGLKSQDSDDFGVDVVTLDNDLDPDYGAGMELAVIIRNTLPDATTIGVSSHDMSAVVDYDVGKGEVDLLINTINQL